VERIDIHPWSVHSARIFLREGHTLIKQVQKKIITILKKNGPTEINKLSEELQIKVSDLERELAVLRHMEKVRGAVVNGKKSVRLW